MKRVMKRGKSHSKEFQGHNGFGQGDVQLLLPALLLVSFQFKAIEKLVPKVEKGAYMDDRNFRGKLQDLLEVGRIVHHFDSLAGHETQAKKTAFITTCNKDKEKLKKVVLQGAKPKLPQQIQIVGYDITTFKKKQCKGTDKRCTKARQCRKN